MTVTCSEFALIKREGPFSFVPDLFMEYVRGIKLKLQARGRVFCRGKWCSRVNYVGCVTRLFGRSYS